NGPAPAPAEVQKALTAPLSAQMRLDLGETVAQLAAARLGVNGTPISVREQAQQMDLTRARVYRLLEDCTKVFRVRWPEGEYMLAALEQKARSTRSSAEVGQIVSALRDLFFHRT